MKNKIKYRDYRIGRDVYTVKLIYKYSGGISSGPAIYFRVMEWHQPPCGLWQRITEFWKYNLNTWTWDPALTDIPLQDYVINKCNLETTRRLEVERGDKEWEVM